MSFLFGGGFPESRAAELETNSTLRAEIKQAIESGMPAYAECGGLMYLSRSLEYQERTYQMVGAIPGDVKMHGKPIGRGCVHLKEDEAHPWPRPNVPAERIKAHEFHYSSLENLPPGARFAYHVERGYGIGQGKFVLQIIMFKINKRRVGTFLCPRGHQPAWADDRAVCPPYDYLENKFTLRHRRQARRARVA